MVQEDLRRFALIRYVIFEDKEMRLWKFGELNVKQI